MSLEFHIKALEEAVAASSLNWRKDRDAISDRHGAVVYRHEIIDCPSQVVSVRVESGHFRIVTTDGMAWELGEDKEITKTIDCGSGAFTVSYRDPWTEDHVMVFNDAKEAVREAEIVVNATYS